MFTGIVEATGRILSKEPGQGDTVRLTLEVGALAQKVAIGDSVAVNGCCLTVVAISGRRLSFDLLGETVRCTSIGDALMGALVNLELSMAIGARLGGHFVAGHVDGTGIIRSIAMEKDDVVLRIEPPKELCKYIVHKGSITIDGISLTVAGDDGDTFHVCLIPHTLEVTNLREKKAGDRVNLESDILARYVEKLMQK